MAHPSFTLSTFSCRYLLQRTSHGTIRPLPPSTLSRTPWQTPPYSKAEAPTCIMTDASSTAVGAVLQQCIDEQWQPLAYFSKALKPSETRYSAFDRELLAIYLAIKHFRYFVEGRQFYVVTDHKPLTFALSNNPDRYSPRQSRHLDYISQFTVDIRHVSGSDNTVADALSRVSVNAIHTWANVPAVDFQAMAVAQTNDPDVQTSGTNSSLNLQQVRTSYNVWRGHLVV